MNGLLRTFCYSHNFKNDLIESIFSSNHYRVAEAQNEQMRAQFEAARAKAAAECALIEARRADRATNDQGKLVVDNLYIGSAEAARNRAWFEAQKIAAVLNACDAEPNHFAEQSFREDGSLLQYMNVRIEDTTTAPLQDHFASTVEWLRARLLEGYEFQHLHCCVNSPSSQTGFGALQERQIAVGGVGCVVSHARTSIAAR